MSVIIKAPNREQNVSFLNKLDDEETCVNPGDVITENTDFMRGHGTYQASSNELRASVAGTVERINKLITVRPAKMRYNGEVGDIVVGRIIEVQQKLWKVDCGTRLNAFLNLAAVNLPGGELRRRGADDELVMRKFLQEGDLILAEVQKVREDGYLNLHTRSLKYGKLGPGVLIIVSPSLIRRRKQHIHNLPCGVTAILATNGFVYFCPLVEEDISIVKEVDSATRENICRLRQVTLSLAKHRVSLYDSSLLYGFEASLHFPVAEIGFESNEEEWLAEMKSRIDRDQQS
ncbi:Oidioi.mRNA.OKI2018_I69.PAR.g12914.t1.cds [Oikopleura dioica]|uniref:Oidioi.mRNA.OKI2018_I69.PAR.g12914.t1.cds n=1 Tax=Oikopleura dioica TaxID=34765 RepID=A0ABN7S5Q0_OIKDI|nr:Oidioi.mRNA.OKI2018_I69.PAR.g12914.t1.cds [Oikopleura dioica]